MRARPKAPVAVGLACLAMLGLSFISGPAVAQNQGPPAPVPILLHLQANPTPTGAIVTWQAVGGSTRYTLHRWKRVDGTKCCEQHVPNVIGFRYVDEPLPGAGRYMYRVVVHLPGNVRGFQEVTLDAAAPPTAPGPPRDRLGSPTGDTSTATLVNPNRPDVAMRTPPGGASGSSQPDPTKVSGGVTDPTGGQGGTQPPGTGSGPTPPVKSRTAFPTLTLTPTQPAGDAAPARSGHYLVTVTGLRAGVTTKDGIGIIDVDGKGDEIMAQAFVRRYNRTTAEPLEYTNLETMPYGDVSGYGTERVAAGRLTSTGGITEGDAIPGDAPVARTMPAQPSVFPWRLWEGTLTDDGDALVINPSIWEYDGNPPDRFTWLQGQQMLTNSIFLSARLQDQIDAKRFGPLVLGANETSTDRFNSLAKFLAEGGIGAVIGLPPLASILGRQRDRPIGIVANQNNSNSTMLPNTTVVLTREIIEAALAAPVPGNVVPAPNAAPYVIIPVFKPGIMVINFEDKAFTSNNTPFDGLFDKKASYFMILQVERLP